MLFTKTERLVLGIGVDVDVKIDLDSGETKFSILPVSFPQKVISVRNEIELTEFVYFKSKELDKNADKIQILSQILDQLDKKHGKYYLKVSKCDSSLMEHVILRKMGKGWIEKLQSDNRFLYFDLRLPKIGQVEKENEMRIVLASSEHAHLISDFQKQRLISMRPSLPSEAEMQKIDTRYSCSALEEKILSKKVCVFLAYSKEGELMGTMLANLHSGETRQSEKIVYLSDLILTDTMLKNDRLLEQFFKGSSRLLRQVAPSTVLATFMAPGSETDPLVRCVRFLEDKRIVEPLTLLEQLKYGLFPYFVKPPPVAPIEQTRLAK